MSFFSPWTPTLTLTPTLNSTPTLTPTLLQNPTLLTALSPPLQIVPDRLRFPYDHVLLLAVDDALALGGGCQGQGSNLLPILLGGGEEDLRLRQR